MPALAALYDTPALFPEVIDGEFDARLRAYRRWRDWIYPDVELLLGEVRVEEAAEIAAAMVEAWTDARDDEEADESLIARLERDFLDRA
jgi:hypothetical protein